MSDDAFSTLRAPVVLRCSTEVANRKIAEVQEVPRLAWEDADELMQDTLKGVLRSRLADRVLVATGNLPDYAAIGLEPVDVHVPTELQDQLYRQSLASIDDA
ncbi:hypothetical protein [Streptomyces anthocyanicus]|uniref:hypothetical protein n=1 Tax=Streptomyces anthocyanicus TaxID=68174 RepID=UPI0018748EFB|nr:hypothetical protein [Streptomyces anthocyanicus]